MKTVEPTLDTLFDSPVRARILKLFLYNPEKWFESKTIAGKLSIGKSLVNKHLKNLEEIRFISKKSASRGKLFKTNQDFDFYGELKMLAAKISPVSKDKMLERIMGLGKIKLAAISGIFIDFDGARADLMLVGDNIKISKFNKFLSDLEAEAGKEINCALMTIKEFNYRYDMYDRFIRDMLEFKHEKLINKLKI